MVFDGFIFITNKNKKYGPIGHDREENYHSVGGSTLLYMDGYQYLWHGQKRLTALRFFMQDD